MRVELSDFLIFARGASLPQAGVAFAPAFFLGSFLNRLVFPERQPCKELNPWHLLHGLYP